MVKYFRLQIKTAIQHEDNPRVYSFLLLSSSKKLAMSIDFAHALHYSDVLRRGNG